MPPPARLDELIIAYLSGDIEPAEAAELEQRLSGDPVARDRFARLAEQEMALRQALVSSGATAQLGEAAAQPAGQQQGAARRFHFCETCGKRVTEHDIAAGAARDKKLKGVYCAACAVGVLTLETLPITEDQARKILSHEPKTESRESPVPSLESTAAGLGSQGERPKPVTRKSGALPLTAPKADPASRDAVPDIHYGTGIHKFVQGQEDARGGSSRRPQTLRRQRPAPLRRTLWPSVAAAGVLVAVTLWLTVGRGGGLTQVSPPAAQQDSKVRGAFEQERQAREEVARREEAAKQAQGKAARAEEERRKIQEQLAELERRKQELAAQVASPAVTEVQTQAEAEKEEARRQELARTEAAQKEAEQKLTQAEAQSRQAEEEVARTEVAQREAERKLALTRRRAAELGRVIFVVELKKEQGAPVLVRGKGADATRLPLTKDQPILAGDRIETGKSSSADISGNAMRPIHAGLELSSGAKVDLADGTNFELTEAAEAKLDEGMLFAEVSGFSSGGAEIPKGAVAGKWVLKTPHAHVVAEHASFELRADAREAILQVEEGGVSFKNEHGAQAVSRLQKSVARKDVAPSPASEILASALWRGKGSTTKARTIFRGHADQIMSVAFSPDGKTLASGCWDGVMKLWDLSSGQERTILKGRPGRIHSVAFSPDGRTLACGGDGENSQVRLLEVSTGTERTTLKKFSAWITTVAFSPDGKTLASSGGESREIWLWDVASGKVRLTLRGHTGTIMSVAYSPDGRTLASGSDDQTVKLWDVATGKERATLKGHTKPVRSVSFSPDGRTLATACEDHLVKLWDVTTGKAWLTLQGHADMIYCVAYSPDGRTLASSSDDQTVKLWDVATGKERSTLRGHTKGVKTLAFSPDGRLLATGSADQTVALWDLK